jgi:hypothetical protein
MNLLFYGLVSEQSENKSKSLKMRGHFIHLKPIEIVKSEPQRYLISDDEVLSEQKFISKKFQSEIPIFFKIKMPNDIAYIKAFCDKCKTCIYANDHLSGSIIECKCKHKLRLGNFDINSFTEFKKDAFLRSDSFFKSKFATMIDNYQMCT